MQKTEITPQWAKAIREYKSYLCLERSLSDNTVKAYIKDIEQLAVYCITTWNCSSFSDVKFDHLKDYLTQIQEEKITARSQARFLSGIKSFFKFLVYDEQLPTSPARLLEAPRIGKKLPTILSVEEIESILNSFDTSTAEGQRNRSIVELLYSSGVRVSELINIKISDIHFKEEFIKVEGKGNKERLIPLGSKAKNEIMRYIKEFRDASQLTNANEDFLFLNRYNQPISRISVFKIIKKAALEVGINKEISPHTFRHSFATQLVEGGADLRVVQDLLGHESILTTELYTHLNNEYLKETVVSFHPRSNLNKQHDK